MLRRFKLMPLAALRAEHVACRRDWTDRKLRSWSGGLAAAVLFGASLAASERADGRALADFTVTVSLKGNGDGFVWGSPVPGGLHCGIGTGIGTGLPSNVCSRTFAEESVPLLLYVNPYWGSRRGTWTGCDDVVDNGYTCVIVEAGDRTVATTIASLSAPPRPEPPPPTPSPPGGAGGEMPLPVPDAAEKKRLEKLSVDYDAAADIYWSIAIGAGGVALIAPPAALGAGVVMIVSGVWGAMHKDVGKDLAKLALDPPDPRYKALATVRPRRVARIEATRAISSELARALTRMRVGAGQLEATLDAILHSVERAQGAAKARDSRWVGAHRAAAIHHARAAAALLERMAPLRANVARALGRRDMRITPRQVRLAQAELQRNGLPGRLRRELRAAGYTPVAISEFARMARTARPPSKPLSVRSVFVDARLRAGERNVAAALRRFAARAMRTP